MARLLGRAQSSSIASADCEALSAMLRELARWRFGLVEDDSPGTDHGVASERRTKEDSLFGGVLLPSLYAAPDPALEPPHPIRRWKRSE